jgi:hypothetical protein
MAQDLAEGTLFVSAGAAIGGQAMYRDPVTDKIVRVTRDPYMPEAPILVRHDRKWVSCIEVKDVRPAWWRRLF